jgi:guanylate kinase
VLIILTGPSGCGKSTILRHVLKDLRHVRFSISHTTRPRRISEAEGREYYFVTPAEFKRMIARNRFLEWAEVHGHLYGTSKKEVASKARTEDLILDIDVQGARSIRERRSDAVFIFILPPKAPELRRRLQDRGEDTPADIRRRLANAKKEIREAATFDYVIINDRLDRAVLELEAIVLSTRCRPDVRRGVIRSIVKTFSTSKG